MTSEATLEVPRWVLEALLGGVEPSLRMRARRHARTLLSQPTPTAEPPRMTTDEDVAEAQALLDQVVRESGVEFMAPGTTFVHLSGLWEVVDGGDAILRNGPGGGITYRTLSQFDPSTIRDVTPPAVTE